MLSSPWSILSLSVVFSAAVLSPVLSLDAQVPTVLNYQGRLAADNLAFTGVGQFKFALLNADGSQTFWRNDADLDNNGEPDAAVLAPISRGVFSVLLGDTNVARMAALPVQVFTNAHLYLRVWFTDGASPFERLGPDQRLAAVGFAIMAATVPEASITAAKLAPGALVASNLVGAISSNQLPDLHASKIATGIFDPNRIPGLGAEKIVAGTFSAARIPTLDASVIGSGTIDPARIAGLNAAQITAGTISPARIPGLDASQIVNGRFSADFLPQNVAYKDTDLLATRNELSAQIAALTHRVDILSAGGPAAPSGATAVSMDAADATLMANGFSVFMNVPASAWISNLELNAPASRYAHASVWAANRDEMFVWGGQVGASTFSAGGGVYESGTDEWRPVTSVAAPSARRGHTMVYDGVGTALVWGGFGDSGYENSGGRFDLDSGSWTPISNLNAPMAREGHVALCERPVMVVWGGRNSAGPLVGGALYNELTDQWSAIPTAGAPSARFGATGLWTGTRFLIWGGTGSAGEVNTGAQLLFQLAPEVLPIQWSPMATLNAPSPRTEHAAVWTGSRMIVWGGRNGGNYLSDGAMFNPAANTWTAISATGAPVARCAAAVAWTGQEMLIFGGDTASGPAATGAAFNPATNRWRPLSSAGDPIARRGASSAWTGSELILFGGRSGALPVAALQRLSPEPTWYFYRKL